MKISEQKGYIVLDGDISPLIKQVIILLKEEAVSTEEEALEITKSMVYRCMEKYHYKRRFKLKNLLIPAIFCVLGIIIGVFVWQF